MVSSTDCNLLNDKSEGDGDRKFGKYIDNTKINKVLGPSEFPKKDMGGLYNAAVDVTGMVVTQAGDGGGALVKQRVDDIEKVSQFAINVMAMMTGKRQKIIDPGFYLANRHVMGTLWSYTKFLDYFVHFNRAEKPVFNRMCLKLKKFLQHRNLHRNTTSSTKPTTYCATSEHRATL